MYRINRISDLVFIMPILSIDVTRRNPLSDNF
jgi:hypothetical protein